MPDGPEGSATSGNAGSASNPTLAFNEIMKVFLSLLLVLAPLAAAQGKFYDNNLHGWLVYSGEHAVTDRWGIHLEGQWRRHEFARPQQLLLRPALNFQLNPNVMLTAGYGWVSTHRYGDFPAPAPFPESRIYEQAIVNHAEKGNSLQHRFRLEQRWIGVRAGQPAGSRLDLGTRYQNRFRYMFRMTRPLKDRLYFATYDEIFLNLPPFGGARAFDQNRAFVGVGWQLGAFNRLETGYMQQSVLQRNGRIMELNHTVHVSLYSTMPFR
jgi:hypothetical protein